MAVDLYGGVDVLQRTIGSCCVNRCEDGAPRLSDRAYLFLERFCAVIDGDESISEVCRVFQELNSQSTV